MMPDDKRALTDLLFRLADDELLIGHRNAEWTGVAPILEEDIAFSSMAQDELGHAQAYYTILHEHLDQTDPNTLAFLRDPKDFRNAQFTALARTDWAHAIMRQFLYDAAEHVRLEVYIDHQFEPLAQLARKIYGEEKYHVLHGRTWIVRLGKATDESNAMLQTALDTLWSHALGLFEAPPHDQEAPFDEATQRQNWLNLVCPLLVESNLKVAASATDGAWTTTVEPVESRYTPPSQDRIDLLDAMQQVYRIDPNAEW
jgi:ring-1,2-phenylacetyl-CoA epoxidase subunit PaaC